MSKTLDRLGKILALADSGATEEERSHALRMAEDMAATLGVELAVARAHHASKTERETPQKRRVVVGNERSRYNAYLVELYCAIAGPHDVVVTVGWRNLHVVAFGLPSDLDIVEALFAVCAVAMVTDADHTLRRGEHKTAGMHGQPVDGRVYRAHFYRGFHSQLQTRLWDARTTAIRNSTGAGDEAGAGTDLVLREKAAEVHDFYKEQTKHLGRIGTWRPPQRNESVHEAVRRGAEAAARTNLANSSEVAGHRREQLAAAQATGTPQ